MRIYDQRMEESLMLKKIAALCLCLTMLAALAVPALAETTKKPIPKSVRIWPGIISENGLDFTLPKKGDREQSGGRENIRSGSGRSRKGNSG